MISEKKKTITIKFFFLATVGAYAFFINYYYADLGVFPIDTFLHYDSGYRILKNEIPIRDFWVVSGFMVDFIQALFFKIFGVNWLSYKIHSSLFNLIISIFILQFFLNLNFSYFKSSIYTISFATLAYTISGTPFVDLHASFFLLISTLTLILALYNPEKKFFWFISILMFCFSFLSKQVPSAYALILQAPIIISYFYLKKANSNYKIITLSSLFIIITFLLILKFLHIDFKTFYLEYIKYPREIGAGRLDFLNISINSFFNKYKFIILPILICIFIQIKNFSKKKNTSNSSNNLKYLLILSLTISLLIHQLMTKNQIFIYFLIPLLFSILDKFLCFEFKKNKKYISIILIVLLISITLKYHLRFNENRKFHELENVKLSNSIEAEKIHFSLKGNLWINPTFKGPPSDEILLIKSSVQEIDNLKEEIMLISNYLFIDSITNKNMNLPSKAFTLDGTTYPRLENKISQDYKNFLYRQIKKKNIKKIYFLKHENLPKKIISEFFDKECLKYYDENFFRVYEIKCLY